MAYDWGGGRTRRLRWMKLGCVGSSLVLTALLATFFLH